MDVTVQSEINRAIFISESTLNIANDILENLLLNVEDLLHHIENRDESPLFKPNTAEEENLLIREMEKIDLEEIDDNAYSDGTEDEPAIDAVVSDNERIVAPRRLIPARSNLLPDIIELGNDSDSNSDDSMDLNSLLDSDSDEEMSVYTFPRAQPSEDVGDRDEFDDMEGMEFVEFYLREAVLRRGYNHGSGDYVLVGSDDEEDDEEIEIM